MFTGIIESTGKIVNIQDSIIEIESSFCHELKIGQSIAHDGVCLTIIEILDTSYKVELIPETFQRTHFKNIQIGTKLNLERCMLAGARFDGHIVQGHCDFVGVVQKITKDKNANIFQIQIPKEYSQYFVEKGSITVNGVSLTVIKAQEDYFSVGIIPHTLEVTNFCKLKKGSLINIETDVFAKYFVKLMKKI